MSAVSQGGQSSDKDKDYSRVKKRPLNVRLFRLAMVSMLLAAIVLSVFALRSFEQQFRPALDKKAFVAADAVQGQIEEALRLGVPFNALVGVDEFLADVLLAHPEVKYLAVVSPTGEVLHGNGPGISQARRLLDARGGAVPSEEGVQMGPFRDLALPIRKSDNPNLPSLGLVHVGVEAAYVRERMEEILYDVIAATLVSLLVTFEVLLIMVTVNVTTPLSLVNALMDRVNRGDFRREIKVSGQVRDEVSHFVVAFNKSIAKLSERYDQVSAKVLAAPASMADQARAELASLAEGMKFAGDGDRKTLFQASLVNVRTPLFMFVFAEEMSRSFFPIYVKQLYEPIPGLSEAVILGLPISLFMLVVAIFTPLSGAWADKYGARKVMLVGIVPAIAGFVGTAFAVSLYDLLFWRCLCAVGYAVMFISAQGYIARHTPPERRAQGMAVFVGAVIAAGICGMSVGGILADRIGFSNTFLLSAGLGLLTALLVYLYLPEEEREEKAAGAAAPSKLKALMLLMRNGRFMTLTLFAAIPTKLMLTGYLFYLVPVHLNAMDVSQSAIGRMMMAYGLTLIALSTLAARFADKRNLHTVFVAAGGLLAGVGALAILRWEQPEAVLFGIVALGLAHAMNNATQLAMAVRTSKVECEMIGQGSVLGLYRLLERSGAILGPMVAAAMATIWGFPAAMAGMGVLAIASGGVFALVFMISGSTPKGEKAG